MSAPNRQSPVLRFAPSPNGALHLGHALSALLNDSIAHRLQGRLLLRIEDIDTGRCTPALEAQMRSDLDWLGLRFETPVRRQSEHVATYRAALDRLMALGLVYPAFLSRAEVKARAAAAGACHQPWPRDPDGALHYPTEERDLDPGEAARRIASGERHSLRLAMDRALALVPSPLTWQETGPAPAAGFVPAAGLLPAAGLAPRDAAQGMESGFGEARTIAANPSAWGDVILWRWDAPSSYHLSVVVDDGLQGITHVVRGLDLYHATSVHRLLQHLLGLHAPWYHHHRLVLDDEGRKLSKSRGSTSLGDLRAQGLSAADLRRRLGF